VSILNPLYDLVAWAIMRIHTVMGAIFGPDSGWAWGLSIAVLVMLIRLCLVPLFVKQVNAQRKMAQHAPQLQELRKKYKNDKQRLQEETMKFYKENGVNPLAGCLPMIPQMIIFISLFGVLRAVAGWKPGTKPAYGLTESVVASAKSATIFGVHLGDKLLLPHTAGLGLGGSLVIVITVIISATTTFMTVRQSAKRGLMQNPGVDPDNPMAQSQKYMQYIVPFFSLTGLYWNYGLVLYWVTTNFWTLGQQYFMFRNWTPPVPAGTVAVPTAAKVAGSSPKSATTKRDGARQGGARTGRVSSGASGAGNRQAASARSANGAARADVPEDGAGKRGLLGLGRGKAEPEPVDDVPTPKVVRQQPQRQARSKRSGKR
jgi:YidC/Oxa1 family membrane protein insertase